MADNRCNIVVGDPLDKRVVGWVVALLLEKAAGPGPLKTGYLGTAKAEHEARLKPEPLANNWAVNETKKILKTV